MTAKEKAEKIVKRMQAQRYKSLGAAAQCALICVDEIVNSSKEYFKNTTYDEFWQEVKKEIRKL